MNEDLREAAEALLAALDRGLAWGEAGGRLRSALKATPTPGPAAAEVLDLIRRVVHYHRNGHPTEEEFIDIVDDAEELLSRT